MPQYVAVWGAESGQTVLVLVQQRTDRRVINETAGYEIQHILQKSEGDGIMNEIGVVVLGFVVTLVIVCVADVVIKINRVVE